MHVGHHPVHQRARPIEVVSEDLFRQVQQWRRIRMSWADIGRNLGVSGPDAQRRFGTPEGSR